MLLSHALARGWHQFPAQDLWTGTLHMTGFLLKHVSATHDRSYRVVVSPGLSTGSVDDLVKAIDGRKTLLVTTPSVAGLYANSIAAKLLEAGVDLSMVVLRCSEQSKTMAEVETLCKDCFRVGLDRKSLIIGCGGGVCTDLVTMAASLTRRGLSHIKIPTTLIGLIDAGIGIKGAVNLPGKKSALGCFCPPDSALLDPAFLRTLTRPLISDGLAEAIKVAIAMDVALFQLLERSAAQVLSTPLTADPHTINELVCRSSTLLLGDLESNLYEEHTYQRLLDFGHTFSPIIESDSQFRITHGTAVALDMALSSCLAFHMGLLSSADRDRILNLLLNVELPVFSDLLTFQLCLKALDEIEAHRGGHLHLVLPSGIGTAVFLARKERLPTPILQRSLDFLRGIAHHTRIPAKSVVLPASVAGQLQPSRTGAYQLFD